MTKITKPGFYWAKATEWEIVKVDTATYGDGTKLAVMAFGSDTWRDLDEYQEYAGPIEPARKKAIDPRATHAGDPRKVNPL